MPLELPLLQSWLTNPEDGFLPGTAAISWGDGMLHLQADLTDEEVITTATNHGQRLWEHGDVAELFIQKQGESGYREYQVSPNGYTLALHYPDITCIADVRSEKKPMEVFLIQEIPVVEVSKTTAGWCLSLRVPLPASPGEIFRVSCCRYDAGTGRPPVISSTSPHPVRDFHRPRDWREFVPVAG